VESVEGDCGEQPLFVVAPESFAEFYERTWSAMVRLARVLIDSPEDAVDVVQDAYSRILPRYVTVESGRADAYARAAVLNGCRRHLRRRRLALLHREQPTVAVGLAADHVLDAVRRLRPDRRDVVLLRYYLDLSESEIARALDIPPGTVKSRLHRALRDLQEKLQ
jgi:DNA-directed RNA polymerase specialized sigma24 family protein